MRSRIFYEIKLFYFVTYKTVIERHAHTERDRERQTDKQTDIQTDIQTEADRENFRERERERDMYLMGLGCYFAIK